MIKESNIKTTPSITKSKEVKPTKKAAKKKKKKKRPHLKVYIMRGNIKSKIDDFLRWGYDVNVGSTNRTTTISVKTPDKDITVFYTGQIVTYKEMHLQRECKREFKSNEHLIEETTEEENYYNFSPSLKDVAKDSGSIYELKNVSEIDITKAYYYSARNLGYISEEFFQKCMVLPKEQRLRLIGSIATRKTVKTFTVESYKKNGKSDEPDDMFIKQDKKLRLAWKNIVINVDKAMSDVMTYLKKDFIFYWVDGIYFYNDGMNKFKVDQIFKKHGFDSTFENHEKVQVVNKFGCLEIQIHKGDTYKPFTVPMSKQKAYQF
jgi:hypothetical protein